MVSTFQFSQLKFCRHFSCVPLVIYSLSISSSLDTKIIFGIECKLLVCYVLHSSNGKKCCQKNGKWDENWKGKLGFLNKLVTATKQLPVLYACVNTHTHSRIQIVINMFLLYGVLSICEKNITICIPCGTFIRNRLTEIRFAGGRK
jgi:hypothetical protein